MYAYMCVFMCFIMYTCVNCPLVSVAVPVVWSDMDRKVPVFGGVWVIHGQESPGVWWCVGQTWTGQESPGVWWCVGQTWTGQESSSVWWCVGQTWTGKFQRLVVCGSDMDRTGKFQCLVVCGSDMDRTGKFQCLVVCMSDMDRKVSVFGGVWVRHGQESPGVWWCVGQTWTGQESPSVC